MPKPGTRLIFLPELFPCEGDWPLAQLPRGAVGSISILGDVHKLFESLLQALLREQGMDNMFSSASSTQIWPFSDSVVLRNSLIPQPSLTGSYMQPPDITLRRQGVSKNKQNKMEEAKGHKKD
ncbi:hypothetical protein DUI87_05465 [Hirundo rustica rustica]|uniref:Uncharacterized protein n=1 Tax=Hirundo rustica rustica TaxID=333673 RepID=A0A3M0KX41_HIRRU|nr:hypothetical protein DUI87_05465 [Hirundo rustica rustica]